MVRVGRMLITFGAVGFVLLLTIASSGIRALVNETAALLVAANVLGALTALALFTGWGMAIYHWGNRYSGAGKRVWGLAVIFGAFIGAFFYWWFAAIAGSTLRAAHSEGLEH